MVVWWWCARGLGAGVSAHGVCVRVRVVGSIERVVTIRSDSKSWFVTTGEGLMDGSEKDGARR